MDTPDNEKDSCGCPECHGMRSNVRNVAYMATLRLSDLFKEIDLAGTDEEKCNAIEALSKLAPSLMGIIEGASYLINLQDAGDDDDDEGSYEDQVEGQLGVACDLFRSMLAADKLTDEHRVAIVEWLADVMEPEENVAAN